jgi:hypothetical protein
MTERGDLYASSNVLAILAILAFSVNPTIVSGEISLIKGKSLAIAMVAARAVFPDPDGP